MSNDYTLDELESSRFKNSPGLITISKNFSRRESLQIWHGKSFEITEIMLGKYETIWCYRIYKICSSIWSLRFLKTTFSDPVMSWWGRIPEDHEKTGTVFFCRYCAVFCCWNFKLFYNSAQQIAQIQKLVDEILVVPEIRLKSSNNPARILI